MRVLKKLSAIFLAVSLAFSSQINCYAIDSSSELSKMYVGEPVCLGNPITSTQFVNCTFGFEDGKNMVYTTATGKPGKLVCYNLDDRVIEREFSLPGSKTIWSHGTDSKGRVYIATQSAASVFRYDPATKQVQNLGKIYDSKGIEQTALYHVSFDKADNAVIGTYPSAMLARYNNETNKFESIIESSDRTNQYIRSQVIIGDYIYCGGNSDDSPFYKVNINTQEITQLPRFSMPSMVEGETATIQSFMGFTPIETENDKLIFACATMSDKRSIMAIFDVETQQWITGDDKVLETNGFYSSPVLDNKVYVHKRVENKLYAFDLTTREYTRTELTGTTNRKSKFIDFGTGKTLVTVQSNGCISYNNFVTGEYEEIDSKKTGEPIEVRSMEPGFKGSNEIYLGAYMGPKLTAMDLTTKEYRTTPMSQIEGMTEAHGKYYMGVYPGANIFEYDPTKPFATGANPNPKKVLELATIEKQDRPFVFLEVGKYVAIACLPDYGLLQGKVTLYNPKTGESKTYDAPKDQTYSGLTYDPVTEKIYGSTSVWGGLGVPPSDTKAKIVELEFDNNADVALKTVKQVDVSLSNCATDVMFVGELSIAKDGALWAVSKGIVFEIDRETLAVKREFKFADTSFDVKSQRSSPYSIEWVSDNIMITNAGGKITALDISTGEYRTLVSSDVSYMTVGEDGSIYYASTNRVYLYMLPFSIDGTVPDNVPDLPKYTTIAYDNYGFNNPDLITESTRTSGETILKKLTFSGISNDPSKTGSVEFVTGGRYTTKDNVTTDFTRYPQNISLSKKDGLNTIKMEIPQKGYQTILQMPRVDFNEELTNQDAYTFNVDMYVTPFESVDAVDKISLDPTNPKCLGNNDLGLYVRFFKADNTQTGADSVRKYARPSDEWQNITIDIPANMIPADAAYMVTYIYCGSANATYETHIANPKFQVLKHPDNKAGLKAEIDISSAINLELYNDDAAKDTFVQTLLDAKSIFEDIDASQNAIDQVMIDLETARKALVLKPQTVYNDILYPSYGFNNPDMITETTKVSSGVKYRALSFSGISNDSTKTGSVQFAYGGANATCDFESYPQSVGLSEKDDMKTIRMQIPHKGYQTILKLPQVNFNEELTNKDAYKFNVKMYVAPFELATTAADISLDPTAPKCLGASDIGMYIRFFDASDKQTGSDFGKKTIKAATTWQDISIDIPANTIPDNAAYMVAFTYCATNNATFETHIANPVFQVKQLVVSTPDPVNKIALLAEISTSDAIDLTLYEDDAARTTFVDALAKAKIINAKEDALQTEVDSAKAALTTARNSLSLITNPTPTPNPIPDPTPIPPVVSESTNRTDVVVAPPAISEITTNNEKTTAKAEIFVDTVITDKATEAKPVEIKTELPTDDVKATIANALTKQVEIKLTVPNAVVTNKNVSITEIKANKSIFEQAKTSGKVVTLSMETVSGKLIASWTFDGTKIANTAVEVNLAVKIVNAETVPEITTAGATADTKPLVVSFNHSGSLPASATVTLDVSTNYKNGEELFLYYFNDKTKNIELVSKSNKVVDGKVKIAISHCSDYVLTKTAVRVAPTKPTIPPKTGDTTPVNAGLVLAIMGSALIIVRKKYFSK